VPTYEYECGSGHTTTVLCRVDDRTETVKCSGCIRQAGRVYSLATVQTMVEHIDTELSEEGSTKPFVVTGHQQRASRMRELNLDIVPTSDRVRENQQRARFNHRGRGR
jgi:predicted nucleic acid-binding Zn ribbon protein